LLAYIECIDARCKEYKEVMIPRRCICGCPLDNAGSCMNPTCYINAESISDIITVRGEKFDI